VADLRDGERQHIRCQVKGVNLVGDPFFPVAVVNCVGAQADANIDKVI